jgi:hypothetical protein
MTGGESVPGSWGNSGDFSFPIRQGRVSSIPEFGAMVDGNSEGFRSQRLRPE